jgi:hypothetical protein
MCLKLMPSSEDAVGSRRAELEEAGARASTHTFQKWRFVQRHATYGGAAGCERRIRRRVLRQRRVIACRVHTCTPHHRTCASTTRTDTRARRSEKPHVFSKCARRGKESAGLPRTHPRADAALVLLVRHARRGIVGGTARAVGILRRRWRVELKASRWAGVAALRVAPTALLACAHAFVFKSRGHPDADACERETVAWRPGGSDSGSLRVSSRGASLTPGRECTGRSYMLCSVGC